MSNNTPPNLPPFPSSIDSPMAIVLELSELLALKDAILIYDLARDGCLSEVVSLMDQDNDGGYVEGTYKALCSAEQKLDKANEVSLRQVKRWVEAMKEFYGDDNEAFSDDEAS